MHTLPPQFAALEAGEDEEDEDVGNDVFMAEYEYDEGWKRFKRRHYAGEARAGGGEAGDDEIDEWAGLGGFTDDESEEDDGGSDGEGGGGDAYRPERRAAPRGGGRGRQHCTVQLQQLVGSDRVRWGSGAALRWGLACPLLTPCRPQLFCNLAAQWHSAARALAPHMRDTKINTRTHARAPFTQSTHINTRTRPPQFASLGVEDVPQPAAARPRDPLSEVHAALSLGSVPAKLPCRDAEKAQLTAFVDKAIRGGGCMGLWLGHLLACCRLAIKQKRCSSLP